MEYNEDFVRIKNLAPEKFGEGKKKVPLFDNPHFSSRYKIEDFGNSLLATGLADDCTNFRIVGRFDFEKFSDSRE